MILNMLSPLLALLLLLFCEVARLGDFGISRFYADSSTTQTRTPISSVGVKGTIGYIAPEYGCGGLVSTSGDVYSFGILLLEMLTGKRPTDPVFEDGLEIINFVEANFRHQIFQVIDANLLGECKEVSQQAREPTETVVHECVESLLELALSCTHQLPSERPNMKQIASTMHSIEASYAAAKSTK
ncbi:hypothetical protein QOZ80_2AG0137460 [Eleusine coracana subsp. coracana]|nr:hypothetical protein QOZ80_2AG0137460 [Eleusine coracana subsp. coracana]